MSFVGAVTGGGDGATTVSNTSTFTLPAGAAAGQVCVVQTAASTGTQTVTTPPSGFSDLGGGAATNSGNTHRSYLYGKLLTAADISAGSFSVVWSSGIRIITTGGVWDGVDPANPFGQVANTIQTSGGTILLPAVTTTVNGSQVVGVTTTRVVSGTASAPTYPADYTMGGFVATNYSSGNNFGGSEAELTTPGPAGSYGNENVTLGGSPVSSSAYSVVLNAVASGATVTAAAALTGAAQVVAGSVVEEPAGAVITGGVTVSAGSVVKARASAAWSATGQVNAVPKVTAQASASAAWSAHAGVSASPVDTHRASAALTGTAQVVTTPHVVVTSGGSWRATGSLAVTPVNHEVTSAAWAAHTALTGAPRVIVRAAVALVGRATLSASTSGGVAASADLVGAVSVTTVSRVVTTGSAHLTGTASVVTTPHDVVTTSCALAARTALVAATVGGSSSSAALRAAAAVSVTGRVVVGSAAALNGHPALTVTGQAVRVGSVVITGVTTVHAGSTGAVPVSAHLTGRVALVAGAALGVHRDLYLDVTPLRPRFRVAGLGSRYTATPTRPRWAVTGLEDSMDVAVSLGAKKYCGGNVTELFKQDITTATFEVSLGTATAPGAWVTPDLNVEGKDANGNPAVNVRTVAMLVTDTTPLGNYFMWIRVTDNPEVEPIRVPDEVVVH